MNSLLHAGLNGHVPVPPNNFFSLMTYLTPTAILLATAGLALARPPPEYPSLSPPLVRVPKLDRPPLIDGRLAPGEWDGAAAIAGFVNYRLDGALSPPAHQPTFYLAYDARFLYLAMRSPNPPGRYPEGRSPRQDGDEVFQDDHIEWQICTHPRDKATQHGYGFFKIVVNPLGTLTDSAEFKGSGILWETGGQTRCTVTPDAWELEISVAIDKLGLDTLDGRSLVMHLARADSSNHNRAFVAWTPGTWLHWDRFGEFVFDPDAPAIQLRSLGDVEDGKLNAEIVLRGGRTPTKATMRIQVLDAAGRSLFDATRNPRAAAGEAAAERFAAEGLALSASSNAVLVEVSTGKQNLLRQHIRVDRLTGDQRKEHIDAWLASRPQKPPVPIKMGVEIPGSPLALMAFNVKRMGPLNAAMADAVRKKDLDEAERACDRMIKEAPFLSSGYYNKACVLAIKGKLDEAFALLDQAIEAGMNDVRHLQADPDLAKLRDDPRFKRALERAAAAKPSTAGFTPIPARPVISNQTVWVDDANVVVFPAFNMPVALYDMPSNPPPAVVSEAEKSWRERPVTAVSGKVGDLLRQWYADGTAAGNVGDLYDNRDGDHSDLARADFPQLVWIEYADHARDAHIQWGLADKIVHNGVVFGNASVAQTGGPYWRSMPRLAYASHNSMTLLYLLYGSNKLYIYPGHVDHTPGHNGDKEIQQGGHGDVFHANTPYLIASQGSSGSDQAAMRAIAMALAALRPETKALLVRNGILAPTLQMLYRMTCKPVQTAEDYFRGSAHPVVFPGGTIDYDRLVETAHALRPDEVPALVQLKVVEEDRMQNGRDFFDIAGMTEEHATTPCAIARIFRGTPYRRRMVVSAAGSKDVNGRPLTYRWALLRGDPAKVAIRPLNAATSTVEIVVAWQPRQPVHEGAKLESNRIEIGAFVHNGAHWSAPAFVTWLTLDNQARVYDADERIQSVVYTGADERGNYVDPQIAPAKSWTDTYRYAPDGRCTGWTRTRGDKSEAFTPDGKLIIRAGADGKPLETREIRYVLRQRTPDGGPVIEQADATVPEAEPPPPPIWED